MDHASSLRRKPFTYGKSRTLQQQARDNKANPRGPNPVIKQDIFGGNDVNLAQSSSNLPISPPLPLDSINLESQLVAKDAPPALKKRKTLGENGGRDAAVKPDTFTKSHHVIREFTSLTGINSSVASSENSPLRRTQFQQRVRTVSRSKISQGEIQSDQSDSSHREGGKAQYLDHDLGQGRSSLYGGSTGSRRLSAPIYSPVHREAGFIQDALLETSTPNPYPSMSEEVVPKVYRRRMTSPQDKEPTTIETSGARRRLIDSLKTHEPEDPGSTNCSDLESLASGKSSDGWVDRSRDPMHDRHPSPLHITSQSQNTVDQHKTSAPSSQTVSSKITYARQRSFLSNQDLLETSLDPSAGSQIPTHDSTLTGADISGQIPGGGETNGVGSVRSIHELRRAGGNARYQGIVGSLLDDVEDSGSPLSARRSALLHLCEKLTDKRFAQRFIENASFERLASAFSNCSDAILCFLCLCSCTLLGQTDTPCMALMRSFWPKLLEFMPCLINLDASILVLMKQRRYNLSKATQAGLEHLYSYLRDHEMPADELPSWISPRRLLLHCILLGIRKSREKGENLETFSAPTLVSLINTLVDGSVKVSKVEPNSEDFITIQMASSILESHATQSKYLGVEYQEAIKPLKNIDRLLVALSDSPDNCCKQLLLTLLRLLLNITNDHSFLCEHFATPELIKSFVRIVLSSFGTATVDFIGENKDSLDTVILTLGALINLTEENETSRKIIFTSELHEQTLLVHLIGLLSDKFDTMSEVG